MGAVEEWEDEGAGRLVRGVEWDCGDCETNEERVAEVERGHGREFVGEAVVCPD